MTIPPILYKYRDYNNEYNKRTLFNFEIFLASASMFNDPYEGSIPFVYNSEDLTKEKLFQKRKLIAKKLHPSWNEMQIDEFCNKAQEEDLINDPEHIEKMRLLNIMEIDKTFGIFSLTPNHMNYLMWSHYANCHKGFCIGFDTKALYDQIDGSIGPVKYQVNIPKMDLFGNSFEFYIKQLSTKSKIWEYEDEFRIVKANGSRKTIKYDKDILKKIVLGCQMSQDDKNEIINFVIAHQINCEISELSLNNEEFILNEMKIY
ncbi:DUF2971 domain-containing protein [Rhodonellum sp.]|uniref:DUF2971 domain-containing protein n=1 Tax=Rhodonellum sp. TaxID=2231180 RepID=UPI00271D3884|nr:DUF2971 domain-containing protein [Rhodonellum sp.]MDO9552493.1 DUF2971 domain-containing protein [Rhodonellum sp.]